MSKSKKMSLTKMFNNAAMNNLGFVNDAISPSFDSGKVYLRSAPSGTGVIAGGPMRAVFEALGIQDIVAKSVGTSNPHNMVRATFEALKSASSPKIIAMRRGLKINDITKRRKINQSGLDNGKN